LLNEDSEAGGWPKEQNSVCFRNIDTLVQQIGNEDDLQLAAPELADHCLALGIIITAMDHFRSNRRTRPFTA
jgi:hypothetical protein